jgi:hypothetical protein
MAEIPNNNSLTRVVAGPTNSELKDTGVPSILRNVGSEYTDADLSFLNKRESIPKLPNATVINDTNPNGVEYTNPTPPEEGDPEFMGPTYNFNGKDPDTVFDALNSQEGWHYNKLSDYHLPTYKIRFFMTEDTPFTFKEFNGSYDAFVKHLTYDRKQTTIVESGVTGMNISSLELATRVAPNIDTRSMITAEMVLHVHEPLGVNLMDIMASTAKELGVKNYSKTGYFLEIKFQGYEDDYTQDEIKYEGGKIETNIYRNAPNRGVWLYYVHLTEIQSEINSTGSNYKLTLQMFEELFNDKDVLQIPDTTMPQGGTINEMLEDFADKLNKSVITMYGYPLMTYKFLVKDLVHDGKEYKPGEFSVSAANIHYQERKSNTMEKAHKELNGSFSRGTMIHDAVEMMFGASEDAMKLAKDVEAQEELNSNDKKMRSCIIWRVRPVVEHTDYDFATEKYVATYTIIVSGHLTQVPVLTREQVEISKEPEVQKKNLIMLRKAGYLAKRYDYIFSGLNTEVLNFDLKLNMNWSNVLPKVMGLNNSMPTQAAHDIYRKDVPTFDDLKSNVTGNQSKLSVLNQQLRDKRDANNTLLNLDKIPDKGDGSDSPRAKAKAEAEARLASVPLTDRELSEDIEELKKVISKEREDLQVAGKARIPPVNPDRETVKYAEEIEYEQRLTESSKPIPVSVTESNEDTRFFFSGGLPDSYHRDRAIMGAVMDQVYNVAGMEMLQNIELEVRGDPYWLGGGNIMRTVLAIQNEKVNTQEPDLNDESFGPNYDKGAIMFLLSFRYPNGVADDGSPILKPHEFFTGVYQAIEINHTFSGGLFKQTIKANRHKLQDVFKAFGVPNEVTPIANPAPATPATFSDVKRT